MDEIIRECNLTSEQRHAILQGIKEGKEKFEEVNLLIGHTTTRKSNPFLQYDLINTHVEKSIKSNPYLYMEVYPKRSGFHPFIVLHDILRNVFVLVLKLPNGKNIFNPSGYRGEFASSNVDRLIEMGFKLDNLPDDYKHQYSLQLGEEHQPFGVIVCYDGHKDVVYEGALRPDQEEWLFKEDITDYINLKTDNITHIARTAPTDEIELPLKKQSDENEDLIVLKLKK